MESKGSNQEPQSSKSEEVSVSSEELTNLISQLQELKVKVEASEASSSRKFELSPIAKSQTGAQEVRKPSTKVLSVESVKYWTALGGPRKIRRLRTEEHVAAPLCRSRRVVDAEDLVINMKAVVLKNARSRYNIEIVDFTKGNILSTFSLVFTEFESQGFLFHSTWQWEVGTWRERASSVWDALTLELLDWEVQATIYAEEKKGTHETWKLFT
jgi:hypothetical protein